MKIIISCMLLLISALSQAGASPAEIYQMSLVANDSSFREHLRTQLAQSDETTSYNVFARAWVASQKGDKKTARELYSEALEMNPALIAAANNLAIIVGEDDPKAAQKMKEQAAEHAVRQGASDAEYYLRAVIYSEKDANIKIQRKQQLAKGNKYQRMAYYFLKSADSESEGDNQQALEYVQSASAIDLSTDVIDREFRLQMNLAAEQGYNHKKKYQLISDFSDKYIVSARFEEYPAAIQEYLVEKVAKETKKLYQTAYSHMNQLWRKAYSIRHSPSMAINLALNLARQDRALEGIAVLDDALDLYPGYSELFDYKADLYNRYIWDGKKAIANGKQAISSAYLPKTKNKYAFNLALSYRDFARAEEGVEYITSLLPAKANKQDAELFAALAMLFISTENFQRADEQLKKASSLGIELKSIYRDTVDLGLAATNTRADYYRKNPFLNGWNQQFNGRLSLAIEFSSNSDVIPKSAYNALDKAALALITSGADNYIFSIEGHTDSSGGAKINNPLSARRAGAVKAYFVERHQIAASKLQVIGYGAEQPIATNSNNRGKQLNRRVDIRPYGNVSAPEVAVAAEIDAYGATFSRDGRYMATGSGPVTLWDINKKLKLRELHVGGKTRAFSPNGRYLAALSNWTDVRGVKSNAIYITDVKTGILESIITYVGDNEKVSEFSWSPFSDKIAYTTNRAALRVYDLATKRTVDSTRISSLQISAKIVWLSDGQHIAVAQARKKRLKVFRAADLKLSKVVEGVDWAHAMAQSADGKRIIVANNDKTISLFDSHKFELVARVKNKLATPRHIIPVPGKPHFIFNDKFGDSVVAVFDYQKQAFIAGKQFDKEPYIGVSPDGAKIYVASGEKLTVHDPESFTSLDEISSTNFTGRGLNWDKENDLLLSQDSGGTTLWNIQQGRRVHSIPKVNEIDWLSVTKNGHKFVSVAESGELLVFDSSNFVMQRLPGIDFEVTSSYREGHYFAVVGRKPGSKEQPTGVGYVALFDLNTFKLLEQIEVEIVNQPVRYDVRNEGISSIAMDIRTNTLAVSTWWNDGDSGNVYSKIVQLFDLDSGLKRDNVYVKREVRDLSFTDVDQGAIKVTGKTSVIGFDLQKKQRTSWQRKGFRKVAVATGDPVYWGLFRLTRGDKTVLSKERIESVIVDEKRNLLLVQTTSNKIIYYSLKDLQARLVINNRKDQQWVAYTPDGYYSASIRGTDNVYWSFGDRFLPFSALKDRYEKPQLIANTLKVLFQGEDITPIKPVIEPDVLDIPFIVSQVGSATVSTEKESYLVKLKIEKLDKSKPDPDFFFTINGRKTRGFEEEPFYDGNEAVYVTRKIPLGVGENKVAANLVYRGVTVSTQHWQITRTESQQVTDTKLPDLWYFGVGVSEYKNNLQNLDFAHRDAIELGKTLENSQGRLFNKVHSKVLVNDQASARDVQIQMNDFLRKAAPDDQIVLFIAGHGVQDSNQTLYFMPHDGDLKRPYTGIAVANFREVLDSRPINQKALFLLDICHAGSTGPGNKGRITSEDVIKKLSEGTSTTVLASSSGSQQSFEDESFGGGHGAFTFSIIEALKGQGDKEMGDLDGYTSLQEVIMYAMREVPRMTNRAQRPVVLQMKDFDDYKLSQNDTN